MIWRHSTRWLTPLLATCLFIGATAATMSWNEPPRFDGAGYATLGRALAEGRGYRVISQPGAPLHAHFPPAYPAVLAVVWGLVGTDDLARFTMVAHPLSVGLMAVAVWWTGRWYRLVEPRGVAVCLTLALAVNWTWVRTGGVIRSEPLASALGGVTLLVAQRRMRRSGLRIHLIALSLLVGAAILTRQVAACWGLALAVDLGLRRGWRSAMGLIGGIGLIVAPWVAWQEWVGSGSQARLFQLDALPRLVARQVLFYGRRIPDAVAGPFVEVATVFGRSAWLGTVATSGALAVSGLVILGWVRLIRCPRHRLGGLIPLVTIALLLVWPFTEAGRFLIPLVPFILLGAVEGGSILLGTLHVRRSRLWASRLVLIGSLPYSIYAVAADRAGVERRLQQDFDAACAWIATQSSPDGPVMARHGGDAAWLTGRLAVDIPEGGPEVILAAIERENVAYLIIDDARYARGSANPLRSLVAAGGPVAAVWNRGAVAIYRVEARTAAP